MERYEVDSSVHFDPSAYEAMLRTRSVRFLNGDMALQHNDEIPLQVLDVSQLEEDAEAGTSSNEESAQKESELRKLLAPTLEENGEYIHFQQPVPTKRCHNVSRRTQAMFGAGTIVVSLALLAFILAVVHGEQNYYDDDDSAYSDETTVTAVEYEGNDAAQDTVDHTTSAQEDYEEEYGEYDDVVVGITTTRGPDPLTQEVEEATQAPYNHFNQELPITTMKSTTTVEPFLGITGPIERRVFWVGRMICREHFVATLCISVAERSCVVKPHDSAEFGSDGTPTVSLLVTRVSAQKASYLTGILKGLSYRCAKYDWFITTT